MLFEGQVLLRAEQLRFNSWFFYIYFISLFLFDNPLFKGLSLTLATAAPILVEPPVHSLVLDVLNS